MRSGVQSGFFAVIGERLWTLHGVNALLHRLVGGSDCIFLLMLGTHRISLSLFLPTTEHDGLPRGIIADGHKKRASSRNALSDVY